MFEQATMHITCKYMYYRLSCCNTMKYGNYEVVKTKTLPFIDPYIINRAFCSMQTWPASGSAEIAGKIILPTKLFVPQKVRMSSTLLYVQCYRESQ